MVEYLSEVQVDLTMLCFLSGYSSVLKKILDAKKCDVENDFESSPLFRLDKICSSKSPESELPKSTWIPPIFYAVLRYTTDPETLDALIAAGADINRVVMSQEPEKIHMGVSIKRTPLLCALEYGCYAAAKALL